MVKQFYAYSSVLSWVFSPQVVWGCSVCFGGAGSQLERGFYWGILLLLLLPVTIIGFAAYAIIRSSRKKAGILSSGKHAS